MALGNGIRKGEMGILGTSVRYGQARRSDGRETAGFDIYACISTWNRGYGYGYGYGYGIWI
jgi:hypothetical protein